MTLQRIEEWIGAIVAEVEVKIWIQLILLLTDWQLIVHLLTNCCSAFLISLCCAASLWPGSALAAAGSLTHYLRRTRLLQMLDRLIWLRILNRSLYLTCAGMMLMHKRRILLTCRQTRHTLRLSLLLAQY